MVANGLDSPWQCYFQSIWMSSSFLFLRTGLLPRYLDSVA